MNGAIEKSNGARRQARGVERKPKWGKKPQMEAERRPEGPAVDFRFTLNCTIQQKSRYSAKEC